MPGELQAALREVRDTLLENPVSPRVESPVDINLHYCRYVAQTVAERVGDDVELSIVEDGGRGYVHTWLVHDGRHYDAECVEGVADYRQLPFFRRHPEAAVHVERADVDPATLRNRAMEPLYPAFLLPADDDARHRLQWTAYWRYAVAGVALGALLFALGFAGEWSLHHHLLGHAAGLETLFIDLELLGELLVVVSPVVFFGLLPYQQASAR